MTRTLTKIPRIYVACLAAYNNGILHGAWIDAAQEPWAIYDSVRAMLAVSPVEQAEEWAIHDHEGFGEVRIAEYDGFDHVSGLAMFIAAHGDIGAALLDHYCGNLDEAQKAMNGRYCGEHPSLADYMQELTEETTTIPPSLRHYIDYAAMGRDAEINGDLFTITAAYDVVHVFSGVLTMEDQAHIHRLIWRGIEIEVTYWPRRWSVIAHLEIYSVQPRRAPLPITATGYRSHFHPCGTVEANGGDVVAQVTAWLDEEAAKPEWQHYVDADRQGELF